MCGLDGEWILGAPGALGDQLVVKSFVTVMHLLAEDRWTHAFGTPTLRHASVRLLDAAIRALAGTSGL